MSSQICGGLRVLGLSLSMPGALATMIMSDAGAEVIKIEALSGDPTRRHYASYMWHRGKKSVTLDLKTPGGRESLHQLVDGGDVRMGVGAAQNMHIGLSVGVEIGGKTPLAAQQTHVFQTRR